MVESAEHLELLAHVLGMVEDGHIFAHHRAGGQRNDEALREVAAVGLVGDYHCGGEYGVGSPVDVVVGGDVGNFHCHGSYDIARNPSCGCLAAVDGLDCAGHAIGIRLGADGKRRITDIVDVVGAHEHKLPVGAEIRTQELGVAGLSRHRIVDEVGVTAYTQGVFLTCQKQTLIHVCLIQSESRDKL